MPQRRSGLLTRGCYSRCHSSEEIHPKKARNGKERKTQQLIDKKGVEPRLEGNHGHQEKKMSSKRTGRVKWKGRRERERGLAKRATPSKGKGERCESISVVARKKDARATQHLGGRKVKLRREVIARTQHKQTHLGRWEKKIKRSRDGYQSKTKDSRCGQPLLGREVRTVSEKGRKT